MDFSVAEEDLMVVSTCAWVQSGLTPFWLQNFADDGEEKSGGQPHQDAGQSLHQARTPLFRALGRRNPPWCR
jgi:hypothetical protein